MSDALVVSSTRAAWLATHGNHPNLVRILGVHHVATGPRLMIEHVDGRDLQALVDAAYPTRIALPECLAIVRDLARGLHFLHELRNEKGTAVRLIHGTLSPALVLIGFDGVARVSGLERLAATRGAPRPLPGYGAPEQSTEGAAVDRRADVYALGAILLRIATGLTMASGAFPVPTSQAVPYVPQSIEDLLRRALSPEPSKRHGTCEELRAAIEGCVVREGLHAAPDQVALMVTRLLPDVGPGVAPLPPRPDASLWRSAPGAPRWLALDSVVDPQPASGRTGFDMVSVQVPRPTLPPVPSPLVPAAAPAAPTMAVDAIKDSGPLRRPSASAPPPPTPVPYVPDPDALPSYFMQAAPVVQQPPPYEQPRYDVPLATELVRLPDEGPRRSIWRDPVFIAGAGLLLFFATLTIAYFAAG